ncbi:MAG: hypothetical protein IKP64_08995 [Selenomonadaceae bacterium]|nr:hypothetical protein [Selenomonadaceae bacterium]MBR4383681.1 hypothetical protein [Selenomonadaceae bacterium]
MTDKDANLPNKKTWSDADIEEFEKVYRPVVEFIQTRHDKCNPYSWIIVRPNGVAFMSDSSWFPFKVQD